MGDYIEEFELPEPLGHAGIMKEGKLFQCYVGGSRIKMGVNSITLARIAIFAYVRLELERHKSTRLQEIEVIEKAIELIGSDYFRLGKFLVIRKDKNARKNS